MVYMSLNGLMFIPFKISVENDYLQFLRNPFSLNICNKGFYLDSKYSKECHFGVVSHKIHLILM